MPNLNLPTLCLAVLFCFVSFCVSVQAEVLDRLTFGDLESESSHSMRFEAETERLPNARRILPPKEESWTTKGIFFTLKVASDRVNYLTFRFCGNEKSTNLLILYANGKQLGYRHLGDWDILHHGGNPAGGERPYFVTAPLPETLTRGQESVELELRMTGRIWGYGVNFQQFQKVVDGPSLPIFEALTHTDPLPDVIPNENQIPLAPRMKDCPVRQFPGEEILEKVEKRIHRELANILRESASRPLTQQKAEFLAKGWSLPGAPVFQDGQVLPAVLAAADAYAFRQEKETSLAWSDPGQYNSDWFGTAPLAEALYRLDSPALQRALDEKIAFPDGTLRVRREVLTKLFRTGLDWEVRHRRQFTNQSLIIDWNIQRMNRALCLIQPESALPEEQVRRYLHESMGLQPWLGPETDSGPLRPFGDEFFQLTPQGLTRELGYVGSYGEVLDWGVLVYLSTCEFGSQGEIRVETGDPEIRSQLSRMAKARSIFRYPAPDEEGFRAMRLETAVGWRDTSFIGPVLYGARTGKEGSAVWIPWVLRDEDSLAAYAQMLEDGQFFPLVEQLLKDGSLRVSNVLIDIPVQYRFLKKELGTLRRTLAAENRSLKRLPMSEGEPDFIFTDEVNGLAVIRNGEEILYVSLYWRARFAVNGFSKVHFISPGFEHFAVLRNRTELTPMKDGTVFRRPNWTNFGFRQDYGVHYPERIESFHHGEELPVAEMPEFVKDFRLGKDNLYAGRGDFYELEYGDYFISMNMDETRTFYSERQKKEIPPMSTRILWKGRVLR